MRLSTQGFAEHRSAGRQDVGIALDSAMSMMLAPGLSTTCAASCCSSCCCGVTANTVTTEVSQ